MNFNERHGNVDFRYLNIYTHYPQYFEYLLSTQIFLDFHFECVSVIVR